MDKFWQLMAIEGAAIGALILVAGALAAVAAFDSSGNSAAILPPGSAAWITFAYTCILGVLPVALFGAPSYWLLLQRGVARWYYALAVGTAPALAFLLVDTNFALWAFVCGAAVALCTHLLCRGLGPNKSFKPSPLRGLA